MDGTLWVFVAAVVVLAGAGRFLVLPMLRGRKGAPEEARQPETAPGTAFGRLSTIR